MRPFATGHFAFPDWEIVGSELDTHGCSVQAGLLSPQECRTVCELYDAEENFRSRIVMARHGFGSGEYKYFTYPLPPLIADLRTALYSPLAAIANRWSGALRMDTSYPVAHQAFLDRCHGAGQKLATPLLLKYGQGGYNCLHQDIYGEHIFPLQAAVLLSHPEKDFSGGEFTLAEQRPRMQSRAEVVPLQQGDGVVFPVRHRPVKGTRGVYRVAMRHGVSRIRSGSRCTLGIIFNDAI
ncbi:MAG TPA: 2OG-Fe(II) oxygenase [Rhizomicrobium sp.]